MSGQPKMVERTCATCKQPFMVKQWTAHSGGGQYCSNRCRLNGQRQMHKYASVPGKAGAGS